MTKEASIFEWAHPREWSSRGGNEPHEPCVIVLTAFAPVHLARVDGDMVYALMTLGKNFPNILAFGLSGTPC